MARFITHGNYHDGNGKIIAGGTVNVYLAIVPPAAVPTIPASIYTASSGGTAVNSVTTDNSGYFYFYIDDTEYASTQRFAMILSASNIDSKLYDDIAVLPVVTSDTVTLTGTQTLTNKTLTTPVIVSLYQDAAKTKLMTVPDTASDTLSAIAATQTLTNKTITTPVLPSFYQDAGKTKLMTTPNTASDTLCAIAATQTLTNKTLISPVINVTSDAEGDTYYRNSGGTLTRLAKGNTGQFLSQLGNVPAWADVTAKWVNLVATTDFATTAASTSTITMNTDQTASLLVGYAVRFTLSSVVYYAQCSAITSSLLTIRGAPLTTGAGALTALSYSPLPSQVMELYLPVDGYYEDATDSALLLTDMRYQYKWNLSKAYAVAISHMQRTVDTGTEANVNVLVNSAAVCTANTNQGRAMSSSADTWVATDIDISTSNYDINYGETIEIQATKAGNGDARDLTVSVVLVFP